ncbi:MAG: class I SAM-dependent methyltransferase [Candidatus Sungbacteria bacterium]|nr:class I SAM-dependent methyltransferase [Candidatus Sungbacteria bacterium]
MDERLDKPSARELNGRPVQCRAIDVRKMRIAYLSRSIRELDFQNEVRSVLELGSGNGFNILALAALHPEVKTWRGVDLTPQGAAVANLFLSNPPLKRLRYVTELDENIIRERLLKSDIQFCEGNMLNLPFSENSFDAAFSCQAIEQLPRDYPRAFQEARRVVVKGAIFLEEFAEAQNIFQWMHLQNVDYFCASYKEIQKSGFNILKFEPFPLNPAHLSLGLLVCSV